MSELYHLDGQPVRFFYNYALSVGWLYFQALPTEGFAKEEDSGSCTPARLGKGRGCPHLLRLRLSSVKRYVNAAQEGRLLSAGEELGKRPKLADRGTHKD